MKHVILKALGGTILFFLASCSHLPSDGLEPKEFAQQMNDFIKFNGWEQEAYSSPLDEKIDLFVDYSTCVNQAKQSSFYRTVHPVIVDANPNFYSIKGSSIKFETDNRQKVYQLLNSVKEYNYADIKGAVEKIVAGNNHAVLITDGEYYLRNSVHDNLNNPYLSDSFRVWLNRGLDIYIYSEPYIESNQYNKFRYYIFFTDSRVENNIQERFHRATPQQNDVELFHLSSKVPTIQKGENYPVINPALSSNTELKCKGSNWDLQEYYTDWGKIYKYLLDAAYDQNGEPLENGDYLVRDLHIDNDIVSSYKLEDMEVLCYNIGTSFQEYQQALMLEEPAPKVQLSRPTHMFKIDEELFHKTGEIALYLDPDHTYEALGKEPNLLRIDFVAKNIRENFSNNNDINGRFQWQSISGSQQGMINTSFYESIRQVVLDPSLNPGLSQNKVLYTLYVSSYNL